MKKIVFCITIALLTCTSSFAADYFWVNGSGNWTDYASHWATSSGGSTFHTQAPTLNDNVYFDANSFTAASQKVTVNTNAVYNDMDWTGALYDPEFARDGTVRTLSIHGSLILIEDMNFNFLGSVYFESISTGKTITSAGQNFKYHVYFNNVGGWILQDGFVQTGSYTVHLVQGTLDLNDMPLTANIFYTSYTNVRTLILGDSIITITASNYSGFDFRGENLTFQGDSSLVRFTGLSGGINHYGWYGPGLAFYDVIFEGANSSYARNASGSFNLITFNGTGYLEGANTTVDSLTFNGNGTITHDGKSINVVEFNADATINNNGTYGEVSISGNGTITGSNTIGDLTLAAGKSYTFNDGQNQLITGTVTANGSCAAPITIQSDHATNQTTLSKSSGSVSVNYCVLQGMNATGGATFTANNTVDLGNNTGWTITPPTAQNLYWIGGTGNWNDPTKWSATSGGSPVNCIPNALDNVFFDGNSFSGTGQTVTIIGDQNNIAYCKNMTWIGATNNPTLAGASSQYLYIYGSLTLVSGMSYTYAGNLYFKATGTGKTVTTAGMNLGSSNWVAFGGEGGGWTLQDALNTGSKYLYFVEGSLNTNNKAVNVGYFYSRYTNTRTLTLGSTEMTITANNYSAFDFRGENFTFNAGTSTIRFTANDAGIYHYGWYGPGLDFHDVIFEGTGTAKAKNGHPSSGSFNTLTFNGTGNLQGGGTTIDSLTFNGNGTIDHDNQDINTLLFNSAATIRNNSADYGKVTMNGNGNITGNNTFDTLIFTVGKTYTLTSGRTQIIDDTLIATGTCSAYIDIHANSSSPTTISKADGEVTVYHCNLQWMTGTGGATFTAQNSLDQGNNSGWAFTTVPLDLYWVGGTGNWDDVNQWSATSGGAGGYCLPTQSDNVYFDNNSFTQTGQAVFINVADASCRNMDWTAAAYAPTFTSTAPSNNLHIYGVLTLIQNMNFAFSGSVYFEGQTPSPTYDITSAGNNFNNHVYFNGTGGDWTLQDDFSTGASNLYLNHGTLNTNGHTVSVTHFISTNDNTRALNLGASVVNVSSGSSQAWYVTGSNFTVTPGTSEIRLMTANGGLWSLGASTLNYHNVIFQNAGGSSTINSDDSFNTVTFNSTGSVTGGGSYSSLVMNLGGQIQGNSSYGSTYFYGNTTINGTNTFSRLLLGDGNTFIFQSGVIQTITGRFIIWGTATNPITIQASSAGTQATIFKAAGTVLGNYIQLKDMAATGGATFDLYSSTDNGNNTGWNFLSPTYLTFPSTTITPGPQQCYEATETITTGGSGNTFIVQNGGNVKLIAGYMVKMLPGTRVYPGGYMWAYITPHGFFCDTVSTMPMAPPDVTTGIPEDQFLTDHRDNSFFRIYPNPTSGVFTLELKDQNNKDRIHVTAYGIYGNIIFQEELAGGTKHEFSLAGKSAGMYFIRVVNGEQNQTKILVKR